MSLMTHHRLSHILSQSPIPLEFNKYWDRPRQTSSSSVSSEASTSSSGTSTSRDSIDAGTLSRRPASAYSLKNLLRNHPYHDVNGVGLL